MSSDESQHIVVLHGWSSDPQTASRWEPLLMELRAHGHTVEYLSIPGLDFETKKSFTLEKYLEWLDETLSKRTTVLMGHSFGGKLAIAYASRGSLTLRGIVLIAHSGFRDSRIIVRIKRNLALALSKLFGPLKTVSIFRSILYLVLREHDYEKATDGQKKTLRNMLPISLEKDAKKVHIPALCLWGQSDTTTPLFLAYKTKRLIPHTQLEIIPDARHSPQFTHSTIVSQKILDFMAEI